MKQVINGQGQDSTAAVAAWLAANNQLWLRNLYLIGEPEDPRALWLTDHESPLLWSLWGTFRPAVIKRGTVNSSIGLDVDKLDLTWSPLPASSSSRIDRAGPYKLAQLGIYDNWPVRVWTCYMPTPGDADTFGCSELFGGYIASSSVERGTVQLTVNSFLNVVNQAVPTNVIELTNTRAAYRAATPPPGFSQVPQFKVLEGSSTRTVIGDCTSPLAHQLFDTNVFQHGYLVFNRGGTLDGVWSAILENYDAMVAGSHYNGFVLYSPLPWAPDPETDTFYVSAAFPINKEDGEYAGFPFVPSPTSSAVG